MYIKLYKEDYIIPKLPNCKKRCAPQNLVRKVVKSNMVTKGWLMPSPLALATLQPFLDHHSFFHPGAALFFHSLAIFGIDI